ncbi:MAG: hypothetical protein QM426_11955 [Euryarchaeota archaeon]|nr:hypothetical protein [Euryarchaeota archaeon]
MPADAGKEYIEQALIYAWKQRLKGLTFYRTAGRQTDRKQTDSRQEADSRQQTGSRQTAGRQTGSRQQTDSKQFST